MDLNLTPLKTSFLAVVQVLAFKVGENDNRATFHIFVNFLKTFSSLCLVLYIKRQMTLSFLRPLLAFKIGEHDKKYHFTFLSLFTNP